MHLLIESNAECERLAKESKDLISKLMSGIKEPLDPIEWKANTDLATRYWKPQEIYRLKEGVVRFSLAGQLFILFEEGDLLGLDLHRNLQNATFSTDFNVVAECIPFTRFLMQALSTAPSTQVWVDFLNKQARLFLQLNSSLLKGGLEPQTKLRQFDEGESIIEQNGTGTSVYHLISGSADVFVDQVKVGEIKEGEIFGLISALTNTPRSATVRAVSICTAAELDREQFQDLIRTRPEAFMKVCADMAETIVRLNQKVVALSRGRQT